MNDREEITPLSRDRRARLAAYLGLLAAYCAAVKNDPLLPLHLAAFAAAATWSLGFEHRLARFFFTAPLKIGLIAAGAAVFVFFIAGRTSGAPEPFANWISRFLFWNAVVFMLSRNKSEYDFWTLAIIQLSLFMISGSFVQPPLFLPLLLASVTCLLYTFQRAAILRCGPAGEQETRGLGLAFLTLFLVLGAAAVVFVAFPRRSFRGEKGVDEANLPSSLPEGTPVAHGPSQTGIPKQPGFLRLTQFHKLKTDPTPVLRIQIRRVDGGPVAPEETLYLRGAVLDTYEDGEWRSDFEKGLREDAEDGRDDGWTPLENPAPGRTIVRSRIRTSALSEDLSFAPADPVRVAWPRAKYDPRGMVFFADPPAGMVEYEVESALLPAAIPPTPSAGPPPEGSLQFPSGLVKLRETALRVLAQAGNGRNARAARLVHYLTHNGFTYTLDPFLPAQGRDPVDHFLDRRAGSCVHYASALALLCRAAGIPARVATGFQLHDPEPDGSFVVKNSDAHAWVEVWFGAAHGWRVYDATPDTAPDFAGLKEGAPVASVEEKKAAAGPARRWDHFLVNYDLGSQSATLSKALRGIRAFMPFLMAALLALAVVAAIGYALLPQGRKRRLRQLVSGFRESTPVDFYRDFLWTLSRRGIRRMPSLTAREFAAVVRARINDDGISFITEKFYEARYAGIAPGPEDRRRIDEILARLSQRNADVANDQAGVVS